MSELDPVYMNSAPYTFERNRMIHAGASEEDAHAASVRAHEASVWGHDARKDSKGRWIPQGIGSENNLSGNHFAALRKREQQGMEAPGTTDRLIRESFKKDRATALRLGLPEPQRAGA